MKFKDYSDFCLWLDENYILYDIILSEEDWSVVQILNGEYWFYEHEQDGSSDVFCKVKPIAQYHYDINTNQDLVFDIVDRVMKNIDSHCAGEQVHDSGITWWWFAKV